MEAIVINGVLPDVARDGKTPQDGIRAYLEKQLSVLRVGGTLLIRDTIAPSDRAPVYLNLNSVDTFESSSGMTVAQLFEQFVVARAECSVYPEEWRQVQKVEEMGSVSRFFAPSRIAGESLFSSGSAAPPRFHRRGSACATAMRVSSLRRSKPPDF